MEARDSERLTLSTHTQTHYIMLRHLPISIAIAASISTIANAQLIPQKEISLTIDNSYQIPSNFNSPEPTRDFNSPEQTQYIMPTSGTITSGYGWRWGRMHKGIDIAAPVGTPIVAAAPGVVVYARWNSGGYGNLVDIQHPDGSLTRYGHNSQILVQEGQQVGQGEAIALVGSTGRSTGPHCHFEIHNPQGIAINPASMLGQSVAVLGN